MHSIEVRHLRVDYDEVTAVDDISFDLEAGKIYGFVGPNGAGKTSTIKALAGILEQTQGSIHLDGFNLETERDKALTHVGYMPDFPPVYENLKVWEYLDVFAAAYGIPLEDRSFHVEHWLKKVALESKRDAFIKGLSRGMRQRLVLAKILEIKPKVLLLDEPASGLDPIARKHMRDLLKEASQKGATILISSHILTELSEFIDAVIVLEKGKIVVGGTLEEIRRQIGGGQRLTMQFLHPDQGKGQFEHMIQRWGIPPENIQHDREHMIIHFQDGEEAPSHFLKEMLNAGVLLKECSIRHDDVEDIFLKVGAKEVA